MFPMFQVIYAHEWMNDAHDQEMQVQLGKTNTRGVTVVAQEFLSNEQHDATNNVVKINIATACDDLIIESIEQSSSSKGKQVVEADDYDEFVKLKNDNKSSRKILKSSRPPTP